MFGAKMYLFDLLRLSGHISKVNHSYRRVKCIARNSADIKLPVVRQLDLKRVLGSRSFRMQSLNDELWRKEIVMARKKGVSGKTHTAQQLNDYANQHNPNSKAYKARVANQKQMSKQKNHKDLGYVADLDWMCYGKGMYEFD